MHAWRAGDEARELPLRAGFDGIGRLALTPSPDASRLAHWYEGVRVLDIETGAIREIDVGLEGLRTLSAGGAVRWSRDGSRLVFVQGGQLVVASGDGGDARAVAPVDGSSLELSADGARVVVGDYGDPGYQLIDLERGEVLVADDTATLQFHVGADPVFSPDAAWAALLFAGDPPDSPTSTLRFLHADGTEARSLEIAAMHGLGWSPDGARYALLGAEGVWLVAPDSGEPVLVPLPTATSVHARWSPTRPEMIVAHGDEDRYDVLVAGSDGSSRAVSLSFTTGSAPEWSPDGDHVLLQSGTLDAATLVTHLIARADWSERAALGTGRFGVFGPPGWLEIAGPGGLVYARVSEPGTDVIQIPTSERELAGAERVAYVVETTVRVARLDGSEDEVVFTAPPPDMPFPEPLVRFVEAPSAPYAFP